MKVDPLTAIPAELIVACLAFLDPGELAQSQQVSIRWRSICQDRALWSNAYARYWRDGLPLPPAFAPLDASVLELMCAQRWRQPLRTDVDTSGSVKPLPATGELHVRSQLSSRGVVSIRGVTELAPLESSVALGRRLCYFEATFATLAAPGSIGIVSISQIHEAVSYGAYSSSHVGWAAVSYGYHGDDGRVYWNAGPHRYDGHHMEYGPAWPATQDAPVVIGCGYWADVGKVFFTRQGRHLGAVDLAITTRKRFAAAVSLHQRGDAVAFNFGRAPFAFDVEAFIASSL